MQRERSTAAERTAPTTPSGTADILLDDAARTSSIGAAMRQLFGSWGYGEVIPPIFERVETLLAGGIHPDWMVRFADPGGDALALRPDFTTQIARVVATRLREQPKPLRLFYVGSVVRRPKPSVGRRAEFAQAGIELVGSSEPTADAEVVAIAIEALTGLGIDDVQVHLGQSAFLRGIIETTRLLDADVRGIEELLDRRDRAALERRLADLALPARCAQRILACLELCGGDDILDRAATLVDSRTSEAALANLAHVCATLRDYGLEDRIVIDLAEVRGLGYYTGLMIEGFSRSLAAPILEGGRYDDLVGRFGHPCPAIGCALDVARIASVLASREAPPPRVDALVRYRPQQRAHAFALAASLRTQGRCVELEVADRTEAEATAYARRRGIVEVQTVGADGTRIVDVASDTVGGGTPWID